MGGPTSALGVRALGDLEIVVDGADVRPHVPAKAAALLTYLVDAGGSATRSRLAGLLWSDQTEERARANLRVALTRLRRYLGAHIETDRLAVRVVGAVEYDVELLDGDKPEEAGRAYRGDFLAGLEFEDAPLFDDWLAARRATLRHRAVEAAIEAAIEAEADGDWSRCLESADLAIGIDPVEERAHRWTIRSCFKLHGRAAALARFQTCVETIERELGLAPEPETLELALEIESGTAGGELDRSLVTTGESPGASGRNNRLLVPPTPFFGRVEELEHCERLLEQGARAVTLVGPGGAGKTRLVERLGDRVRPGFDRLVVVELHGVASDDRVVTTAASAFGVSSLDLVDGLITEVNTERTLLVIDNADQVARAAGRLIAELVTNCPDLRVVTTSREVLGASVEHVVAIDGLGETIDGQSDPAAAMFVERARRYDPEVSNDDDVQAICALLGRLPLAIELAARWTGAMSVSEIAHRLSDGIEFLESDDSDVPDRHRSMRHVLDVTWMQLDEVDQKSLSALSVFRGGFDTAAATAVAHTSPSDLQRLANRSLLRRVPGGRFAMHELVRQYAGSQSSEAERHDARNRHAQAILGDLAASRPTLLNSSAARTIDRLDAEFENIVSAWQHALGNGGEELLVDATSPLAIFGISATRHNEVAELIRGAVSMTSGAAQGHFLSYELVVTWRRLPIDSATELFNRARDLLSAADSHSRLVLVSVYATTVTENAGDVEAALELAESALAEAVAFGDDELVAELELTTGRAHGVAGRFRESEERLVASFERFDALGNSWGAADAVGLLAATYAEQYRVRDAMEADRKALALWTARGDQQSMCTGHANLGSSFILVGAWDEALHHTIRALRMAEDQRDRLFAGYLHCQVAEIEVGRGRFAEAEAQFLVGIADLRAEEFAIGQRLKLPEWARLLVGQQRWLEAELVVDEALEVCDKIGGDHFIVTVDAVRARVLLGMGRSTEAAELVSDVWRRIQLTGANGLPQPVVSMADCAMVFDALGDIDAADSVRTLARRRIREVASALNDPGHRQSYLALAPVVSLLGSQSLVEPNSRVSGVGGTRSR